MLAFCLLGLLTSCTTLQRKEVAWPDNIPPLEYYEAYYAQDSENQRAQSREDYLGWVKRFYKGWVVFALGWQPMTEELMEAIEGREGAVQVEQTMADIGRRVSAEWAKETEYRKIHTKHLLVWGTVLKEAVYRNEERILVARVSADVDALLAGELDSRSVVEERYYDLGYGDGGDFNEDF